MEHFAGIEAFQRALRLSLIVDAQHVAGIVAKKICDNAAGALDRSGEREQPRGEHGLFSFGLLSKQGNDLFQHAVILNR